MLKRSSTKAFETCPDLEFDYFLTRELGLGTVEDMRNRMSMAEYAGWSMYYRRQAQRTELGRLRAG